MSEMLSRNVFGMTAWEDGRTGRAVFVSWCGTLQAISMRTLTTRRQHRHAGLRHGSGLTKVGSRLWWELGARNGAGLG